MFLQHLVRGFSEIKNILVRVFFGIVADFRQRHFEFVAIGSKTAILVKCLVDNPDYVFSGFHAFLQILLGRLDFLLQRNSLFIIGFKYLDRLIQRFKEAALECVSVFHVPQDRLSYLKGQQFADRLLGRMLEYLGPVAVDMNRWGQTPRKACFTGVWRLMWVMDS